MPQSSTSISSDERNRVVRKLAATVGLSAAMQAAVFLALAWAFRLLAQLALEATARMTGGRLPASAEMLAAILVVALDLFTALAVGFFAARRLLRTIVRSTPHPMKPPTRPIPWASLCAAGVIAVFSILAYAADVRPIASAWYGWTFELLRDAAIVALFWFAAVRAVGPKVV